MENLLKIQTQIEWITSNFERIQHQTCLINQITLENNKKIFTIMRKIFSTNLIPLHIILIMLADNDIFSLAATCKTLHKIIFSPFGFRILKTMRPLVVELTKFQQQPVMNVAMYDFGHDKIDRMLEEDDDNLQAVIMTMNTNILAMMQKIKQIEKAMKKYNSKSKTLMTTFNQQAKLKEGFMQKNQLRELKLQKLDSIGKNNEHHVRNLINDQNRIYGERIQKITNLEKQRQKLQGQKQLLIKKLKALTKEAQDEQSMSLQIKNIMKKIDQIVKKK